MIKSIAVQSETTPKASTAARRLRPAQAVPARPDPRLDGCIDERLGVGTPSAFSIYNTQLTQQCGACASERTGVSSFFQGKSELTPIFPTLVRRLQRAPRPRRCSRLAVEAIEKRLAPSPTLPLPPPHDPGLVASFTPPGPCAKPAASFYPPDPI